MDCLRRNSAHSAYILHPTQHKILLPKRVAGNGEEEGKLQPKREERWKYFHLPSGSGRPNWVTIPTVGRQTLSFLHKLKGQRDLSISFQSLLRPCNGQEKTESQPPVAVCLITRVILPPTPLSSTREISTSSTQLRFPHIHPTNFYVRRRRMQLGRTFWMTLHSFTLTQAVRKRDCYFISYSIFIHSIK